ncbi:hypothetical protein CMV30_18705 [Nibricoccus aquaticus]|uniref:Uncharacterized protein n=1 Tax=Nibricoccus aquaticus TaxID=2576891 RepID=A0A290QAT5_9BACT|nr:DUF4838 domain-containing protein [Nibricoccus aquaticus]ATC65815.1 hypothetical protein CMV30_18705 [Nibricoccus aquaticus]
MIKTIFAHRYLRRLIPAILLAAATAAQAAGTAGLEIVKDGKANAVIVTPKRANKTVTYAAQELVYHVQKATGVTLPVQTEGSGQSTGTRIYLGDTEAARAAGLDGQKLAAETFVLRTASNALYIVGKDANEKPLDQAQPFGSFNTSAGTLFGVYEWMDRDLGVRWLWPGELGTYVPKTRTVVVQPVDETISPRFFQRNVRPGLEYKFGHSALGFTPRAAEEYGREQTVFLRRYRMGRNQPMSYRHAFTDWWEKYGKDHPEWFQLVNGKRGPINPGDRYAMCVSNVELQKKIVELWKERGGDKSQGLLSFINAVENDYLGSCECEHCRAWDGPQPPDRDKYYAPNFKVYGTHFMSDRYARFALEIQKLAAKENPNAAVIGYVYFNYFQAPTSDIKLNSNVILGFCPSAGWYPRTDDEHQWYKDQWDGWKKTGARVFVRHNYFLDGYSMPFIVAHQFADDFQYQAKGGMFGTDFDSLTGQWSTQGPTLYLLMRLHTHPEAPVDKLLAEYYSGFGPAAEQVKAYFDFWEKYTMDNRQLITDVFYDRVAIRWRTWAKAAHRVFPENCFAAGEELLAKAEAAAKNDPESAARVAFLRTGLTHAKLCSKVAALLTQADPQSTPERGKAALEELLRFRRAHEREWFSNLSHSAWVEDISWKLSNETKQEPEYYP